MDSTSTSPFVATSLYTAKVWCCWNCWKENFLRHRTSKAHHWPSRSQSGVFHSNCDLNMPSKSVEFNTPSGTVYLIEGAGGVLQINVRFSFANVVDIRIYYSNLSEEDTTRSLAKSQSHPNNRNLMARIIYGAIGTEIRGKVGGTVFQGNKHGYTIKNKGLNTNNTSSRQRSMKSNIIAVTQAWRSLSSTQRTNFIALPQLIPNTIKKTGTSKLGGYEVSYYGT